MAPSDWTNSAVFQTRYIYLRTKTAINYAERAIDAILDRLPARGTWELLGSNDAHFWENGMVLKTTSLMPPGMLANDLSNALDLFDAWAIYDGLDKFTETMKEGLIDSFFERSGLEGQGGYADCAQIFMTFRHREKEPDAIADQIRNCFAPRMCMPVFHFRDGRILMAKSAQTAASLMARCRRPAKRLHKFTVCDFRGEIETSSDQFAYWRESFEFDDE